MECTRNFKWPSVQRWQSKRKEYILEWNLNNLSVWILSVPFSLKATSKCTDHVNVNKLYAVEYINTVCSLDYPFQWRKIIVCKGEGIESMWNDHWSIMKPVYFIIWFSFNINFRLSIKWYSRAQKVIEHKYVKYTCSMETVQQNLAVLHS